MEIRSDKRNKNDLYQTPYSITRQLLDVEKFVGSILEPACGNGAIVKVLEEKYSDVTGQDIENDFLKETKTFDNIITNPPFSLALEFIVQAKLLANDKIAYLLPITYLNGKKRFEQVWQDKKFPLARVYIFTRYAWLTSDDVRDDGKYESHGLNSLAWFIWEKNYQGEPVIRWIDNASHITKKTK
jgi:hypothetical protein